MKGSLHKTMAQEACNTVGVDGDDDDIIKEQVVKPDDPNVSASVPDWVVHDQTIEDGMSKAIEDIMRYFGHYYDADPFWGTYYCDHNDDAHSADWNGFGGAPEAAQYHFNKAERYCCDTQDKWVGRTLHYTQDMCVPLHTGMGREQANFEMGYSDGEAYAEFRPMKWLHKGYEIYVRDRWDKYEDFSEHYGANKCDGCYGYHVYNRADTEVTELADYTGQYSSEVYHQIADECTRDWTKWDSTTRDKLEKITQNCLQKTGLKDRGLLHRYYD
jgi:hypothetical protein